MTTEIEFPNQDQIEFPDERIAPINPDQYKNDRQINRK